MTSRLVHTVDMLMGLAERLALLAKHDPYTYIDRYNEIMKRIEKEERPSMKRMSQADTILFLMRKGHKLTNKSLIVNHKIASPTRRISDLRDRGIDVQVKWKTCPVDGSKYAEYSMKEAANA